MGIATLHEYRLLRVLQRPTWLAAVVVTIYAVGCVRTDASKEMTLASKDRWIVKAIGDLETPSMPFARNVVEFQAIRNQAVYARGPLYDIGPHDRGFATQYPERRWVGDSSLQFWISPQNAVLGTYRLHVSNRSAGVLRWLTVSTKPELLLLIDVQPAQTLEFSLYRWANGPHFSVEGEWISGAAISRDTHGLDAYLSDVSLILEPSGVSIKSGTPINRP